MQNRSTENLINSDGSIEELFMPPSAPSRLAPSHKLNNNGEKQLPVAAVTSNLPIPAKRKSLLPAITSDDSKDSKNDRNQKTQNLWKLNEAIGSPNNTQAKLVLVNERKTADGENAQSAPTQSVSDNESQRTDVEELSATKPDAIQAKSRRQIREKVRDEIDRPERLPIARSQSGDNGYEQQPVTEVVSVEAEPPMPRTKSKRKQKRKSHKRSTSAHSRDLDAHVPTSSDLPLEKYKLQEDSNEPYKMIGRALEISSN